MTDQTAPAFGQATLTDCDREVIHIPGAVQAHGVLLVVSEPELRIVQASVNMRRHLQLAADRMLGQPLSLMLDSAAMAAVQAVLSEDLVEPRYLPPLITSVGYRMDAVIHRTEDGLILELEPSLQQADLDIAGMFRRMLAAVHAAPTLLAGCAEATRRLRGMTGFDRVMIYRFRADGAGEVIAEDRREDMDAFLGLSYPASDIPQQARRLFVLNPLRVWTATDGSPAAITPSVNPTTGAPLDMSRCALRAASPIHLEYLRNMGVGASMALSIVRDGALWGMIVCHHDSSRYVPHPQRVACESIGHLLALQIESKVREERSAEMARLHEWTVRSLGHVRPGAGLFGSLQALGPRLLEFVPATGVVVHAGGKAFAFGRTPSATVISGLIRALASDGAGDVVATDRIRERFEGVEGVATCEQCGLLALPVSRMAEDFVIWFRDEITETVTWAGNPNKPMEHGPLGSRLTPRASFDAWVETVRGHSEPWKDVYLEAARAFGRTILEFTPRRGGDDLGPKVDATRVQQTLLVDDLERRVHEALQAARMAADQTHLLVASLERLSEGLNRR